MTTNDRQRVAHDARRTLCLIIDAEVPFTTVTSVVIIPFLDSGEIVAIRQNRGLDIPGGHVLKTETNLDQVARREALEEAGIILGETRVIGYLRSDVKVQKSDDASHIAVLTAPVVECLPWSDKFDALERVYVTAPELVRQYTAGDSDLLSALISAAQAK